VIIDHGRLLAAGSPAALASGTADGSIRFTTDPGIDAAGLAAAVGPGTAVDEERSGGYRLRPPAGASSPQVVATIAGWLAERELALGDLRTGQSLEEAYLAITGSRGAPEEPEGEDEPGGRGRRAGRAGSGR